MTTLKFPKNRKLSGKKEIDTLFEKGKSFNLSPIRVIYSQNSSKKAKTQILFSVPSRVFKKAVERNLLKRRMRESFRLNQSKLELPVKLNLAYIYIAKQTFPFSEIEKKVIQSFKRLSNEFEE
jgi:ribonuclease P protein component